MSIQRPIYLVIAILIPILMIIATALGIYFTKINLRPERNFVYGMINKDDKYDCRMEAKNIIFKAQKQAETKPSTQTDARSEEQTCNFPDLYLYNFKTDTSQKITLEQAQNIASPAPSNSRSADGYYITEYCDNGMPILTGFFSRSNYPSVCVKKDRYEKRLNINPLSPKENKSFFFIGWTKEKS